MSPEQSLSSAGGPVVGLVVGRRGPLVATHGLADTARTVLVEAGLSVVEDLSDVPAGAGVVLHDAHCPAASAVALVAVLAEVGEDDVCAVGVRPVTDTVKELVPDAGGPGAGRLGDTVDRESLVAVTTPVVVPAAHVGLLRQAPDLDDLPGTVAWLRELTPVRLVAVDAATRRIADASDLALLRAATPAGEDG